MRAVLLLGVLALAGFARTPAERLSSTYLEAVHTQRVDWKRKRPPYPDIQGVYRDIRTVILSAPVDPALLETAARDAQVQAVFGSGFQGFRDGVLYLDRPDFQGTPIVRPAGIDIQWQRQAAKRRKEYPDEVAGARMDRSGELLAHWDQVLPEDASVGFAETPLEAKPDAAALRAVATHVLARRVDAEELATSLQAGHVYVAHDWLADPIGFTFVAQNGIGTFEMGDQVQYDPSQGPTVIEAAVPIPGTLRLLRDGELIQEEHGTGLSRVVDREGAYRLEVLLAAGGELRPWIYSNPLYVRMPWSVSLPPGKTPPDVEVAAGIPYIDDGENKHRLDLYLPRGRTGYPVLVFFHGGAWRVGDRSQYRALGQRLARAGIGVAIPSYRLMGVKANPHPTEMEDAAAAFAWVHQHIGTYGADASRTYIAGHSSGGHMASLLALDPRYLGAYKLSPEDIRGVISMSGVYNVDQMPGFHAEGDRRDASPIHHVTAQAPRFLITYCQWDYLGLPQQARRFAENLKKALVPTQVVFLKGDNHISEIVNLAREKGPLLDAVLEFVK